MVRAPGRPQPRPLGHFPALFDLALHLVEEPCRRLAEVVAQEVTGRLRLSLPVSPTLLLLRLVAHSSARGSRVCVVQTDRCTVRNRLAPKRRDLCALSEEGIR